MATEQTAKDPRTGVRLLGLVVATLLAVLVVPPGTRAETPANRVAPAVDSGLVVDAHAVKQSAEALANYMKTVISVAGGGQKGNRHKVSGNDLVLVRARLGLLVENVCRLKDRVQESRDRLGLHKIEDERLRKKLLKCLDKNVEIAKKLATKLDAKFNPKPKNPGDSPPAPKVMRARPLLKRILTVENAMADARDALLSVKGESRVSSSDTSARPGYRASFGSRSSRLPTVSSEMTAARIRLRRSPFLGGSTSPETKKKNGYLGIASTREAAIAEGFFFAVLSLEPSGDFEAFMDTGLFSGKRSVREASGDGEMGFVEFRTVGDGPLDDFVTLCGRRDAESDGFEAFLSTPDGDRLATFLPGVEVAEFRATFEGGHVEFHVRDAAVRGSWSLVDSIESPPHPMTLGFGAAGLRENDEVGFDKLLVVPF